MVDGNTGKSGNKIWVAILSFLTVAIVGLVVAIVVVNMRGGEETAYVEMTSDMIYDTLDDIGMQVYLLDDDDAIEYLTKKISEYEGTELEVKLKIMRASVMGYSGYLDEANVELGAINVDALSVRDKMDYYSTISNLYGLVGDEDNKEYYNDLAMEYYYQIAGVNNGE